MPRALANGTAVRLNGITIGYLDKLQLTGSRDPKRAVEFDMQVQPEYLCRKSRWIRVVGIAAANLLGDKFLEHHQGTERRSTWRTAPN